MTKKSKSKAYDVGYAKPPRETQFKPGQSGNLFGRRRRRREREQGPFDALKKVLNQNVTIREGGKLRKVPLDEAMMHQLAAKAFSGDAAAIKEMLKIKTLIAKMEKDQEDAQPPTADFYLNGIGMVSVDALRILKIVEGKLLQRWVVEAALARPELGNLSLNQVNQVRLAMGMDPLPPED